MAIRKTKIGSALGRLMRRFFTGGVFLVLPAALLSPLQGENPLPTAATVGFVGSPLVVPAENMTELPDPPPNAGEQLFSFRFQKGDAYLVDKYQDILILENGVQKSREEKNRIILKVDDQTGDTAKMDGSFVTYSRTPRKVGEFRHDKTYLTKFDFDKNGQYRVPLKYEMPNLVSLPSFPDRAVKVGDTWEMDASESLGAGASKVMIPFKVRYRYHGLQELKLDDGTTKKFHRIDYVYKFNFSINDPKMNIKKIQGYAADALWFDTDLGIPVFDTDRLVYRFTLADGREVQYRFKIDSWHRKVRRATEDSRQQLAEKVKDQIKEDKNLTVRKTDQGVVIQMDSILFDTDSSKLRPEVKESIGRIAQVLKEQSGREFQVSGHTDSTGDARYNKTLSEERARAVLKELTSQHGIDPKQLSYRGYGKDRPVADNRTEEGRQKNRRVEVLIVTE